MEAAAAVTGVLLAGGQSRRLGRDKRLEPFAGQPLIARVAGRLGEVCQELVAVVAGEAGAPSLPLPPGARVVPDAYPGKGSLGGIYSGLAAASHPWAVVVACDMPFLSVRLLRHLLSLREGFDAVVPVIEGYPEPAHAAYSKTCLPVIQRQLERGELKIARFFGQVRVRQVPEDEVRRFDPELHSFFNINTPEDLAQALALAGERAHAD